MNGGVYFNPEFLISLNMDLSEVNPRLFHPLVKMVLVSTLDM